MSKEVKYTALHNAVFVPGAAGIAGGTIGPTLDLNAQSQVAKMTLEGDLLLVETKTTVRAKSVKFAVPTVNIKLLVFKEEKKTSETDSKV